MTIDPVEYERRYYGRVYGKRRARVCENQDPERRGRIKVENTELYGSTPSPWVMPCFPFYGGVDCGFFSIPPIGSMVWIECEEGLPEYPVYAGGFFDLSSKGHPSDGSPIEDSYDYQTTKSTVPPHGRGDYDGSDYGSLKGRFGVPSSSFEGDYGETTILQTKAGHKLEFDDTEGGERVQIHHAKGAHIEILPDGSIVIATEGKLTTRSSHQEEVVVSSKRSFVGGEVQEDMEGDHRTTVFGTQASTVNGESNITVGSSSFTAGDVVADLGDLDVTSTNNIQLSIGGELGVVTFSDLDFNVAGKGFSSFSNALSAPPIPPAPFVSPSGSISATNGTLRMTSSDQANISTYGVETRGGTNGQVYLGALDAVSTTSSLGVTHIPLLKERAVIGEQLTLFLNAVLTSLDTFYLTMQTGGATPGFGGPNPILASASAAALTSLTTTRATYLTTGLFLSDCVYLSKV